jgi:hypothetical protein
MSAPASNKVSAHFTCPCAQACKGTIYETFKASLAVLSMQTCKNLSHIQVLVIYFIPTPPIKLKLELQTGGRLLIATHLDQSNYPANQEQEAVNKYDLTVFIRLFQGSSRPLKDVHFQGHSNFPVGPLNMTAAPHPKIPM